MQNLLESAVALQQKLRRSDILSAVIGGIAVAVWGEPRLTRGTDLKLKMVRQEAQRLVDTLRDSYIFLAKDPLETLPRMGFIFVKDGSGIRLDLLLADTPFDQQAVDRAKEVEVAPKIFLSVCSPEDLILYKMISTRPRDREDVRGIFLRQKEGLDNSYILKWLRQFEQALDDSTLVKEYQRLRGVKEVKKGIR